MLLHYLVHINLEPKRYVIESRMGPLIPASFSLFSFFSHSDSNEKCSIWTIYIEKSVDGELRTQTRVGRMEGADESTELWRHPILICKIIKLIY